MKRKPARLKAISGTIRLCREVPVVPLTRLEVAPAAPEWLPNAHAVKEWNRVAPILAKAGLLSDGGLTALANLCAIRGKLIEHGAADECPTGQTLMHYAALTSAFVLKPVAQGKVKTSEKKH